MGFWGTVSGVSVHQRAFRWILAKKDEDEGQEKKSSWFLGRFLTAADRLVEAKGPEWAQGRVWGRRLGVWVLLLIWFLPTVALAAWAAIGFVRIGMERPEPRPLAPRPRLVLPTRRPQ